MAAMVDDMNQSQTLTRRKLVFYTILSLIIITAGIWLYNYLTVGTLEVTNKSGSIVLNRPTVNGLPGKQISQASNQLKQKLKAGDYIVSATTSSTAALQFVHVQAHRLAVYDITPIAPRFFEPVLAENSQDIAIGDRLTYLSTSESKLYQVDPGNSLSAISPDVSFRLVRWADPDYGVAQDSSGGLYVINGTSVSQLSIPSSIKQKQYLQYAVTKNRSIYLYSASNLYLGSEKTGFKQIASGLDPASLLIAGNSDLALINDGDTNTKSESAPSITVISNGKAVTHDAIGSFVGAWSTNDSYLAISSQNGGEILNSKLKHVAGISQSSLKNPVWLSDSDLAYSTLGQLWLYNLTSHRSDLIGSANAGETINEITPSKDGLYLYMKVTGVNGISTIRRMSLKGTAVSPMLAKLTIFLPLNLPQCSAGYINFTKPGVLIRPHDTSQTKQCLDTVRSELADDQIDINSLTFSIGPALLLD
jgi:hypothetical protein